MNQNTIFVSPCVCNEGMMTAYRIILLILLHPAPEHPANLSLSPVNSSSLLLTWEDPGRPSLIDYFLINWGNESQNVTRENNESFEYSYVVQRGLEPGTEYQLFIASVGPGGNSPSVASSASTCE